LSAGTHQHNGNLIAIIIPSSVRSRSGLPRLRRSGAAADGRAIDVAEADAGLGEADQRWERRSVSRQCRDPRGERKLRRGGTSPV
jgi:hypothetical protein